MKNRIKKYRKENKISTRKFALSLGISHRTVEGWEMGRHIPNSMKILIRVVYPEL